MGLGTIIFDASLFNTQSDRQRSETALYLLLYSLTLIDCDYILRNPGVPTLYRSGVRYERENGQEVWQAIPTLIKSRFGDCEDLATWLAADYNVHPDYSG